MNWLVMWFLLGGAAVCAFSPVAHAQMVSAEPIRVESNVVLVPVQVIDMKGFDRIHQTDPNVLLREIGVGDFHLWEALAVRDLVASDFRVMEDGHEQKIQSVTPNRPLSNVRDNVGQHLEYIGTGGGRWSFPDSAKRLGMNFDVFLPFRGYLIAYFPPESPTGSCHQVTVKVNRPNTRVFGRSEYCTAKHSASDPLEGTKLGKQMETDLSSTNDGTIGLSLAAVALFGGTDAGVYPVHISLEFPSKSLKYESKNGVAIATIGIVGMIYTKHGALTARFSDSESPDFSGGLIVAQTTVDSPKREVLGLPNHYETEIHLPAGEYELRIIFSEGKTFGRVDIPITVESNDGKQLAVSEIALAKRFRETPADSAEASPKLPVRYAPLVSKGVEIPVTANTHFKKGESFCFYFEVYEPEVAGQLVTTVEAGLRIVDAKTGEVKIALQPGSATPFINPGNPVIPLGGGIDISNLPKGSYRLEVQATDSAGKRTAWRATYFTIE
jgi:hypothetical protein